MDVPRAVRRLYRAHVETIRDAPLLKARTLPNGYTLFDWRDITPREQEAIRRRQHEDTPDAHPDALDPFQRPNQISTTCSVGVRHESDIAGCMVVHRLRDDVMQYTSLFVRPTVHRHRVAWMLLAEAIRRQINRTEATRGVWMVDLDRKSVV